MILSFHDLKQRVQGQPAKRVAVVEPRDQALLEAVSHAQKEGLAEFILLGEASEITHLLAGSQLNFRVIHSEQPSIDAVELIHQGEADLLMKGSISTGTLLKAVLDKDRGLRKGDLLNHIAVIQSPAYHKLIFLSDGGINLHLNEDVFKQMIWNNVDYLAHLGIMNPKIAMLALVEIENPKIPETVVAANVARALASQYQIEGPIAPDVALSREAALLKGLDSQIAGDVDMLMMSNTTAGNHFVKGLVSLGGCLVGGVIVGAQVPIILLSRSDDADTRYRSILLGLV
jgi:phosphate butyryltransferase